MTKNTTIKTNLQHQNIQAEQLTLGALFGKPGYFPEIHSILKPEDFTQPEHRKIFQAMCQLADLGDPIDYSTVRLHLGENGVNSVYMVELYERVGDASNAVYYARQVKAAADRRKMLALTDKISANIKGGGDALDLISQLVSLTDNGLSKEGIISGRQLLAQQYTQRADVIGRGILPEGAGLMIAVESGLGKSMLRTELAIHLVMGWDFLELEISRARRVLIIQFENTNWTEQFRLNRMLTGLGIDNFPDNLFFSNPTHRYDLKKVKDTSEAESLIKKCNAEVVIWDQLTSLHSENENDNVKMRHVLDNITLINRKTNTTSIVIHHFGKPQEGVHDYYRTRGASAIRDWCDTLITLSRKAHEDKTLINMGFAKVRNGPEPKAKLLERDNDYFIHHITEEDVLCPPSKVRQILVDLGGRVEGQKQLKDAIMGQVGCSEKSARGFISAAVERGAIETDDTRKGVKKIYQIGVG